MSRIQIKGETIVIVRGDTGGGGAPIAAALPAGERPPQYLQQIRTALSSLSVTAGQGPSGIASRKAARDRLLERGLCAGK